MIGGDELDVEKTKKRRKCLTDGKKAWVLEYKNIKQTSSEKRGGVNSKKR